MQQLWYRAVGGDVLLVVDQVHDDGTVDLLWHKITQPEPHRLERVTVMPRGAYCPLGCAYEPEA